MRYRVRHTSKLAYAAPVARARFNLRLSPALRHGQSLLSQDLHLSPEPALREVEAGPYRVTTTRAAFDAPLKTLEVTIRFEIDVSVPPIPTSAPTIAQLRAEAIADRDLSDLAPAPYLFPSRVATMSEAITRWAAPHLPPETDVLTAVSNLMAALHAAFTYDPKATSTRTPPQEAFEARAGVCQDFAHILIIALRGHGVPAAYVSGYLLTRPPPGQAKLVGADAMHAWVDVWCGAQLGWVGFDPTNNCLAREDHIAIGMGRDYADVSPIDGTFLGSAPQSMSSAVDVERID